MQQIVHRNHIETNQIFGVGEFASIIYHDMFDYPLTFKDMLRWRTGPGVRPLAKEAVVVQTSGYYYLDGQKPLILKRTMRARISNKKIKIAEKSANVLSIIPTVKMVGITGALAMRNASDDADIDLMIVTSKGTLWSTRIAAYILLRFFGLKMRKPNNKDQKDKLCINIWVDEGNLSWRKKSRNIFTAHEIAQIEPLYDAGEIYKRLMEENRWIRKYWPNAVQRRYYVKKRKENVYKSVFVLPFLLFESFARYVQMLYMRNKVTRETITSTKALFHPVDWSSIVLGRLQSRLSIS